MRDREKYLPGPTDTAALSLGGENDDAETKRREAVQAVLGHLQRREGEVGSVPARILREHAFDVDGGETVESARDGWSVYVRPALAALDTVDEVAPGRWRYCGASKAAETIRAAGSDDLETGEVENTDDADTTAALSDAERRGIHATAALAAASGRTYDDVADALDDESEQEPAPALGGDPDDPRNTNAALAAGVRADDARAGLDSDASLSARAWTPSSTPSPSPRGASNVDGPDDGENAESASCARCGDVPGEVDAPVLDARFDGDDRLCTGCFTALASGVERRDRVDRGEQ